MSCVHVVTGGELSNNRVCNLSGLNYWDQTAWTTVPVCSLSPSPHYSLWIVACFTYKVVGGAKTPINELDRNFTVHTSSSCGSYSTLSASMWALFAFMAVDLIFWEQRALSTRIASWVESKVWSFSSGNLGSKKITSYTVIQWKNSI